MILIVDDDNAVRMALGLMLKQARVEWEAVGNEADALAAVRTHEPEIVILDMNLTIGTTGRQGLELLRKIKAAQYVAAHPGEVCPAKWKEGESTLAPSLDLVGKI